MAEEGPITKDVRQAADRLALSLAACRSFEEVAESIAADDTLASLGAEGSALFILDDEKVLRLEHARGILRTGTEERRIELPSEALVARAVREDAVTTGGDGRDLALPLTARGEPLGCWLLALGKPSGLSPQELVTCKAMGKSVAIALMAARSREAERDLRARIQGLRTASLAIAEQLAVLPEKHLRAAVLREFRLWPSIREEIPPDFLRDVLQAIVAHARQAVGARFGALGIGDVPGQPFRPWVFTGVSEEQAAAIGRVPRPVGALGVVACQGELIRTPDVRAHQAFRGFPAHHPDIGSLLGVPVRYRGVSLGNLYLGNKIGEAAFTLDDQHVAELLASQVAVSLQQAYYRATIDGQRAQLQIILDCAPHGLIFVSSQTDQVIANPRAMELLGRNVVPEAGRDQYLSQVARPDGRRLALEELPSTRALAGEHISGLELLILQPEGRRVPILVSAAPVPGVEDSIIGAVVTFQDISSLKELDRLREEFSAIVVHDLRGPLQAILLHVDALLRRPDGDEVRVPRSIIEHIGQSVHRLWQMTQDLFDATRIELGRVSLERKSLDVSEAVRVLVERIRPLFGRHPVGVTVLGSIPCVRVDPTRLEQIVTNLLDNAAKFSQEEAPISVEMQTADGGVELSVTDRGPGISAEELPRLFDRFYQSTRARAQKTGLGLGLHIAKGLVEAHGGRIWVESEPGKGSAFHVWLPRTEDQHLEH
jgi:signal transduction histidine kinase